MSGSAATDLFGTLAEVLVTPEDVFRALATIDHVPVILAEKLTDGLDSEYAALAIAHQDTLQEVRITCRTMVLSAYTLGSILRAARTGEHPDAPSDDRIVKGMVRLARVSGRASNRARVVDRALEEALAGGADAPRHIRDEDGI